MFPSNIARFQKIQVLLENRQMKTKKFGVAESQNLQKKGEKKV